MREKIRIALGKEHIRGEIFSIHRLRELQQDLEALRERNLLSKSFFEEKLSGFSFSPPVEIPGSGAVIAVAIPQPVSRVIFHHRDGTLTALIPPTYISRDDTRKVTRLLEEILGAEGYRLTRASLPQKLLAVRAGLGEYGLNNVFYVPGAGSFFRLAAFFTDLPCAEDNWREPLLMERCTECRVCMNNCPTGCIGEERILIRADRCLTYFNESEADFPEWIRGVRHNALVGCMVCQDVCPANRGSLDNMIDAGSFSEEETALLLEGCPPDLLPAATREKLDRMELLDYSVVLSRNLKALLNARL
ncbi:MAG: 4Fe-4S double cluster binding domain-containing protein [Bacillota bacterium]